MVDLYDIQLFVRSIDAHLPKLHNTNIFNIVNNALVKLKYLILFLVTFYVLCFTFFLKCPMCRCHLGWTLIILIEKFKVFRTSDKTLSSVNGKKEEFYHSESLCDISYVTYSSLGRNTSKYFRNTRIIVILRIFYTFLKCTIYNLVDIFYKSSYIDILKGKTTKIKVSINRNNGLNFKYSL